MAGQARRCLLHRRHLVPRRTRHVAAREKSTAERFKAAPTRGKRRCFVQFYDAAQSWSRVERIIARVEAGPADHLLGFQRLVLDDRVQDVAEILVHDRCAHRGSGEFNSDMAASLKG